MGGGTLRLVFNSGNLSAHFDAWADFLINYRPFSFIADVGIHVGIAYKLTIFCVTKHFQVDFGAALHLQGPPVAGYARIDWYIITFEVHFGSSNPPTAALTWEEFVGLIRQDDPSKPATIEPNTGSGMHSYSAIAGLLTNQGQNAPVKTTSVDRWTVNGILLAFSFDSLFPITQFDYPEGNPASYVSSQRTFMKPMHIADGASKVTSKVGVEITASDTSGAPSPKCNLSPIIKQVPSALWGPYDPATDPSTGQSPASLLNPNGATVPQVMGILVSHPDPTESPDIIELSINSACAYDVFLTNDPVLPGGDAIPATYTDSTEVSHPTTDSTGQLLKTSFDRARNLYAPLTPTAPYNSLNILGRLKYPKLPSSTILDSWMAFQGVTTADPLGARIADLESCGMPSLWVKEMSNDYTRTAPLPVLSAEASIDALGSVVDGFGTKEWQGAGPRLNREFQIGSLTVV